MLLLQILRPRLPVFSCRVANFSGYGSCLSHYAASTSVWSVTSHGSHSFCCNLPNIMEQLTIACFPSPTIVNWISSCDHIVWWVLPSIRIRHTHIWNAYVCFICNRDRNSGCCCCCYILFCLSLEEFHFETRLTSNCSNQLVAAASVICSKHGFK